MRFLLVTNHCISDPTAGMTHSLRTIAKWLGETGHTCRVLTTARFGSPVPFTIEDHLRQFGVDLPAGVEKRDTGRAVVEYAVNGIPVTLLMTQSEDERYPDRAETKQFEGLAHRLLDEFEPDQLIACNSHQMIRSAIAEARNRTVTTVFALRGLGYYDPRFFAHVDHVLTCSEFLTDHYRQRIGLQSTPIEPPIDWSSVVAPAESRAFVTFVNPSPHKGLYAFARLADMLGSRRPDIPVLVVQSGQSGGSLNAIRGLDFGKYPQIMAAPATETPAAYFSLTRILLVPSVLEEPFGRVAAEAMINGIPPIVSDRGSLPHVVGGDFSRGGGGRVLPLPDWLTTKSTRLPGEGDMEPWFDAVCALWDDNVHYETMAVRARQIADARYSEEVSRRLHVEYFTSLKPGGRPLADPTGRQ